MKHTTVPFVRFILTVASPVTPPLLWNAVAVLALKIIPCTLCKHALNTHPTNYYRHSELRLHSCLTSFVQHIATSTRKTLYWLFCPNWTCKGVLMKTSLNFTTDMLIQCIHWCLTNFHRFGPTSLLNKTL